MQSASGAELRPTELGIVRILAPLNGAGDYLDTSNRATEADPGLIKVVRRSAR
jgi:hypothetical protein